MASDNLPSVADLRQFLTDTFNDEEITSLCFDYFPNVHDNFTLGMSKAQRIQSLIEYCQRRGVVPNLHAAIQRARPEQYQKRFPRGHDPKQVFVSHAHEDAELAHRLAVDLNKHGWHVWIAPDSIRPGEKWVEAINRGLEESGVFVLLLTPAAARSRWVIDETNVAVGLEHQGRLRFIPLAACRRGTNNGPPANETMYIFAGRPAQKWVRTLWTVQKHAFSHPSRLSIRLGHLHFWHQACG